MTAQSPSAYLSSATLHAAAVVLLLAAAWVVKQQTRPPVKIFELVAGEGDNWAATAAPALGSPGGVKLKVPATAEPVPRIAEPEPTPPTPVQTAPIQEAAPAPPTTAKTTATKTPDLVRTVKQTAAKVEQKMAQKQRMEEAIAADKARKHRAFLGQQGVRPVGARRLQAGTVRRNPAVRPERRRHAKLSPLAGLGTAMPPYTFGLRVSPRSTELTASFRLSQRGLIICRLQPP
jgi:hypothetical protein